MMDVDVTQCIGCGGCRLVCRWNALRQNADGTYRIDSVRCRECGACADACPSGAIRRPAVREEIPR